MQCRDPFRLATAIGVGENDARSTAATLLTLGRVGDDDVLAGDVLAAGLAMMFRLRSGLRGSQSRMARPTPSQPLREQGKICAGPRPSQGISNIGRSTRSQPGRFTTPRHHHDDARRTTGVTGGFLDALHAPKEFCLSLAAVQHTSLSHAASTQPLLRPIGGWNSSTESLYLSKMKPYDGVRRLTSCYEMKSYDGFRRQTSCYEYSPPGFPLAAGTAPQIGKPDSH